MSEKSYATYVRNPGVFWHSVQSWVKWTIVLVGTVIGLFVWFTGLSATFPLIALIFLGTAVSANIVKILIVLAGITSLLIIPLLAFWLLRLIVYAISYFIIMSNEDASMGDFIFKTKE